MRMLCWYYNIFKVFVDYSSIHFFLRSGFLMFKRVIRKWDSKQYEEIAIS